MPGGLSTGVPVLGNGESGASDTERSIAHWKSGGARGDGTSTGCWCHEACTDRVRDVDLVMWSVSAWHVVSSTNVDDHSNGDFPREDLLCFSYPCSIESSLPVPIGPLGRPTCFVGLIPRMPWVPDLGSLGVVSTNVID